MRVVVSALALLSLIAPVTHAYDVPVTGATLLLKQSASGKQKLVFQSKDPTFPFPAHDGPEDPMNVGATIELITPGVQPPGREIVREPDLAPRGSLFPTHR